ncbi:hypothetical protein [Rhizorhabdus dicambivorans]
MTYDPEFDHVYIGVGDGSTWNHQIRSQGKGDNWFLASIVALDRKTGQYAWHYQASPGDTWDATATQNIVLTDLEIGGKPHKVLMQAPKNGFYYVIDRANGRLLSVKNRTDGEDGRRAAGASDQWAYGIDLKTGRPLENPEARYLGGKMVRVRPTGWAPIAGSRCHSTRRPVLPTFPSRIGHRLSRLIPAISAPEHTGERLGCGRAVAQEPQNPWRFRQGPERQATGLGRQKPARGLVGGPRYWG